MRNEQFGQMRMLSPYLFANQIREGAVLRRVGLSPKAFSSELLSPDFARVGRASLTPINVESV